MLTPLPASDWGEPQAAHLLGRAGFGAPPEEVRRVTRLGLTQAVHELLDYDRQAEGPPPPAWTDPNPERWALQKEAREAGRRARQAPAAERPALEQRQRELQRQYLRLQRQQITELRAWWISRMTSGHRPLQEKLTLFWHGHFATSIQKVRDSWLMWQQNQIFRQHALGPCKPLFLAVSQDPAMLLWLDQAQSRKEHPNENFARELLELFTLGEGSYTEGDVTETARAFTGWSLDRERYQFINRPRWHDPGTKTILGRQARFDGEQVLDLLLSQSQFHRHLCTRLWRFFASDTPPPGALDALASTLAASKGDLRPVLQQLFTSTAFYSETTRRQLVKSPVQWLTQAVRSLEIPLPAPAVQERMLNSLGQELFAPPNVKGWDGGLSWITTNTLIHRYNYSNLLVFGKLPAELVPNGGNPRNNRRDFLARRRKETTTTPVASTAWFPSLETISPDALLATLEQRLLHAPLRPSQRSLLQHHLQSIGTPDRHERLEIVRLVMSTPDYQMT